MIPCHFADIKRFKTTCEYVINSYSEMVWGCDLTEEYSEETYYTT